MRSLRAVAIVSHILPVLLVAPLVSLVLALLIETRILMPGLAASAAARVALLREAALVQPDIWGGGAVARRFVDDAAAAAGGAVLLLDRNLVILAQSGPEGEIVVAAPPTANATVQVRVRYGWASQQALAVAGVAPAGGSLLGYLAYSESGGGHASPFTTLRWLVGGVLLAQLALAGVAGALLALRLARPIAEAADALGAVAASQTQAPLVEGGPTEIRRLLAAVNRLAARLAGLEQQRRQAFANIVHELGRPLGAVRSAIYVLRGPTGADQKVRDELLAGIDDEITRMQPLLDDLTQLYAQVEGRSRPQCATVNVGAWLHGLAGPWRATATEHGIAFRLAIPDDLPTLSLDPELLARAIGNLLSNAVKYTPAGGTVALEAGYGEDELWIAVADDGPGIDPRDHEHIFEPFDRGGRRFPEGLGLGLSIARDLVAAHGGRLALDSAQGAGSRFTIWLPLGPI